MNNATRNPQPATRHIVALAGGVGGAKLAHGLAQHLDPDHLTIVVNTGDDFEHLGLLICPDLDTVLYNLAEINHPGQGWGREDESFGVLDELKRLGHDAWFLLGDKDIALHLFRRHLLDAGCSLTAVVAALSQRLGLAHPILPMSDQPVRTIIFTPDGELPFQEYFVHRRCQPTMLGMRLDGLDQAQPSPAVASALAGADAVIFCPSNPYVSIDPILSLPGLRARVAAKSAIAISPIIGGQALKGPAAKMMAEMGVEVSALGVARHYAGLLAGFVIDHADADHAAAIRDLGMQVLVTDTVMADKSGRKRLAADTLAFARHLLRETA